MNREHSRLLLAVAFALAFGSACTSSVFIGSDDVPPPDGSSGVDANDLEDAGSSTDSTVLSETAAADSFVPESGVSDTTTEATACSGDLSNIGTANFHVSFTITISQPGQVALLNQRTLCGHGNFWDIRMRNGGIYAETDALPEPASYSQLQSLGARIDDGNPHVIKLSRIDGLATVLIDGQPRMTVTSPASFGNLAPVKIGADVCVGNAGDPTVLLGTGMIQNVCIGAP